MRESCLVKSRRIKLELENDDELHVELITKYRRAAREISGLLHRIARAAVTKSGAARCGALQRCFPSVSRSIRKFVKAQGQFSDHFARLLTTVLKMMRWLVNWATNLVHSGLRYNTVGSEIQK